MCKGKQLLVSLRDGLDLKICKDSKILNPIWLLQEFKILKLEGRTGTTHVCWQWSLIAEWNYDIKFIKLSVDYHTLMHSAILTIVS